ncbi:MAG TPA: glucose 1-dehydrogenase, partial [Microthrixaceae bacterium]|nr:glucose 1-dehydrogenase [Microthrixaceae bacterium]
MGRLEEKVAIITGAAAGMGRLGALRFAEEGARVVVADLAADEVESCVSEVRAGGGDAIGVVVDVRDPAAVEAMVRTAVDRYGRLDVLYNNAGVSPRDDDTPETTSVETWDLTFAVNVKGVFLCCKYAIPAMLASGRSGGGASIVNVASFVGHMGAATPQLAYTSSKGAVVAMTREIAAIYARQGIRANALCPGPVLTPLLSKFLSDDAKRQRRLVHIPMGRFGEAIEMVNGALFLASDESSYMTGQSLLIDGGIT